MSELVAAKNMSLSLVTQDMGVKQRFERMLGKRANAYLSSIVSVAQRSSALSECDPWDVVRCGAIAASFNLPVDPNLGFAYMVPYREKGGRPRPQFQIGYKGLIQLAMRSGQYKTINADVIYEGQIKKRDRLRGLMEFDEDESNWNFDKVVGYFAYFQTLNGMEKMVEMSTDQVKSHANKYSKSYQRKDGGSPWVTNFDEMALKTVIKKLLSKWGILSIDMQLHEAVRLDQATPQEIDGEYAYLDSVEAENAEPAPRTPPKKSKRLTEKVTGKSAEDAAADAVDKEISEGK